MNEDLLEAERVQQESDIKTVLSTKSGRRFVARLLDYSKTFGSVLGPDVPTTYYNAGFQDFGHWLYSEIAEADPNLIPKLIKDAYTNKEKV